MKKKIFLSFFTIFLLVIIIEIIAAILSLRPSNNNYGWLNAHQTYKNVIKKIETNEYGTRDTFVKDKNKKNIILLGDSQIELAQEKKNMPARLLERYQDNYNVYSFGSWGWGNDQQLLLLKKTIKKIKPKYVILFFTINDINDNFHNIGYLGEKPTFNYNSNGLIYPSEKKNLLKRYLNYSYIYRLTFRAYLFYQNFKYESFQEGNEFQKRNNCKSDNGKSIKKLLESVRDLESFKRQRYKIGDNLKSYTQLSNDEIEKKINDIFYQFLDYRNNYEKITDKKTDYFRDFKTKLEKKKIKLTNLLLNEIQSISEKNNAQFILMHVINKNFWLEKDINYQICYKNKIINYSNQNHIKVYNETFANIKKIFKYSVPRDLEWYNSYDGHLSYKYNKKIFKELSKFIFN